MDYAFAPEQGRVAVVSPTVYYLIERYFEDAKIPYQTIINDQITSNGVMLRLSGFDIVKDTSAGMGKTNTDDDKHTMFFFNRGTEGAAFAMQLQQITSFDGINGAEHDGVYIRGRLLWGDAVIEPNKFRLTKLSIT